MTRFVLFAAGEKLKTSIKAQEALVYQKFQNCTTTRVCWYWQQDRRPL